MESDEFECKAEPYRLEDTRQKFELAKMYRHLPMRAAECVVIGLETKRDAVFREMW